MGPKGDAFMEKSFFINNRNKVARMLEPNSFLILFAGGAPTKSADEEYNFTPNRNFYYLTGINETNDILVLKNIDGFIEEEIYINRYDELKAKWIGKSLDDDEIRSISGINNVNYTDEFDYLFLDKIGDKLVYLDIEKLDIEFPSTKAEEFLMTYPQFRIECGNVFLKNARMVKDDCEVNKIIKANEITRHGVEAILSGLTPGLYEYQVESLFDQQIKWHGASDFAFKTIAAGGKNACVLHYSENNCLLNENELILFDLGAEYQYYKADVSRTFPISGKFTDRQKLLYNIVLGGQEVIFGFAKAGLTTRDLNNELIKYYQVELRKIGLIETDSEVSKYYFHGVSHHLGLDTHDISILEPLKAGAVITVEPGLYIAEEGIGIRIEDDILITEDGCVNLSKGILKTVEDIENFMNSK